MEKQNQYMEVAYQLFVEGDNGLEMMEEAPQQRPFQFITGFGIALDAFEAQLAGLEKGAEFDITIPKDQAYGEYHDEWVLDLPIDTFTIDGKLDSKNVYVDAIVPLQNDEGRRFFGRVAEIGKEQVKIDLNHPLAGDDLHFKGTIVESRPATPEEISQQVARMTGGCKGGCGGCGGGDCGSCGNGCGGCS